MLTFFLFEGTVITSTPTHPPPQKKSSILCKTQVASAQKPVVQPPNYVSRLFSFAPSVKNSCFSTPFPLPCCIPGLRAWLTSLLLTTGVSVCRVKWCRRAVAPDLVLLPRGSTSPGPLCPCHSRLASLQPLTLTAVALLFWGRPKQRWLQMRRDSRSLGSEPWGTPMLAALKSRLCSLQSHPVLLCAPKPSPAPETFPPESELWP